MSRLDVVAILERFDENCRAIAEDFRRAIDHIVGIITYADYRVCFELQRFVQHLRSGFVTCRFAQLDEASQ